MESQVVDTGVHLECVTDLLRHASVATTRRDYVRAVRPTVPHAVGVGATQEPSVSIRTGGSRAGSESDRASSSCRHP